MTMFSSVNEALWQGHHCIMFMWKKHNNNTIVQHCYGRKLQKYCCAAAFTTVTPPYDADVEQKSDSNICCITWDENKLQQHGLWSIHSTTVYILLEKKFTTVILPCNAKHSEIFRIILLLWRAAVKEGTTLQFLWKHQLQKCWHFKFMQKHVYIHSTSVLLFHLCSHFEQTQSHEKSIKTYPLQILYFDTLP